MKNWIKTRLSVFLDIGIIKHNLELENRKLREELYDIKQLNKKVIEENNFIMKQFNISADISPNQYDENWAVISVKNKPEYVKFVRLSNQDVRSVRDYLKHFERTNMTIDSPFPHDIFKF
jgi:hypothetical protein